MHTQWQDSNKKRFQGREEETFFSIFRQIQLLRIHFEALG